jgi:hypothetical protein
MKNLFCALLLGCVLAGLARESSCNNNCWKEYRKDAVYHSCPQV